MTTNTTRRVARFVALPVVSAGLLAGVLGFAGAANAGTYSQDHTPRPGIVATPNHTAPSATGTYGHRIDHLMHVQPGYTP
ncbi:hypothetical protein [Mycolicibacterium holsaticum]|jgi:hypothetical protein|uniref:DUF2613 domain-containing protein n=1 Tax=Mycolicibacterium holsaticum TaxID=152142 RepID=A0A1E3RU88_9MYCO|nr:hypothetical protein [Mycolicibacterium holsaticum]MDA4108783.1 hypothetical protein [Mycolicibacterium holsaticum DSM 44478 = JCM 12374]ODQ93473.1 hypothetical protein BHQ17_13355 [Mycolicibacterium holsaticum]QZA12512.1 hypothetical protein K3U96_25965 [Mycolicibacterium holsaticum DSM 44478 = JCM 12374]UNC10007.1 hypothetical protein H5U41_00835 [Mycolicibacterium holsaticum DSM 44478 = JCM 12374]